MFTGGECPSASIPTGDHVGGLDDAEMANDDGTQCLVLFMMMIMVIMRLEYAGKAL